MSVRALRWLLPALSMACAACSAASEHYVEGPAARDPGRPVLFDFGTTDGGRLSHRTTHGRATAILFVTTYDTFSQLQARRLDNLIRRFGSRFNAAAVVLEPPKYAVMADVFRTTLNLSYPVAISGGSVEQPAGGFGRIDRVPTLVILDTEGREAFRYSGPLSPKKMEEQLLAAGG